MSFIMIGTKESVTRVSGISRGRLWAARLMCGVVVLFMGVDGVGKIAKPAQVVGSTLALGFAEKHLVLLGVLGLFCTFLYAVPRTRFLGVLLLTGYLGGAVAAQVRVDSPLPTHVMFPIYVAVLAWGAIWITDRRLRNLLLERV